MRYPVWFVRFLFAAWMIPAGLNHFIPLFPQPMGSQPLSQELIRALERDNVRYVILSSKGHLYGLKDTHKRGKIFPIFDL